MLFYIYYYFTQKVHRNRVQTCIQNRVHGLECESYQTVFLKVAYFIRYMQESDRHGKRIMWRVHESALVACITELMSVEFRV